MLTWPQSQATFDVCVEGCQSPANALIRYLSHGALALIILTLASTVILHYLQPAQDDKNMPTSESPRWIEAILMPFVSEMEAMELRKRRLRRLHKTLDPVASENGHCDQRRRAMRMLVIAYAQVASSAVQAGFLIGQGRMSMSATEVLVSWICAALLMIADPPQRPPYLLLVLVNTLASISLFRILDQVPQYSEPRLLITHLLDLVLSIAFIFQGLSAPMSPGGIGAVVSSEELQRLKNGQVIEEADELDQVYDDCPTSPEDYASLWAIVSYGWMNGIQSLSLRRALQATDIWRLRDINDVHQLFLRYRQLPGGLLARIVKLNANDIALDATYKIIGVSLAYAGPAVMKQILDAIAASDNGLNSEEVWRLRQSAFIWAVVGLILTMVRFLSELQNFHHARQVGLRIRIALTQELFIKTLKRRDIGIDNPATGSNKTSNVSPTHVNEGDLRPPGRGVVDAVLETADLTAAAEQEADAELRASHMAAREETDASPVKADIGRLINLMSNAVNDLLRMGCDLHQLYGAPAEVVIATTFLYSILGWPALAGFSVLVLALPLNYLLGRRNMRLQKQYAEDRDARLDLLSELIRAIRYLKLQAAEQFWKQKITDARDAELKSLLACHVVGKDLTVSVAFTSITLFYMLRAPLGVIPTFLTLGLQALVSVRRLETFLAEDEVDHTTSQLKRDAEAAGPQNTDPKTLSTEHATFSYGPTKFELRNISLDLGPGLNVICGPNGSGKSTLLSALLGELPLIEGTVRLPKFQGVDSEHPSNVSYVSQACWVQDGISVRNNILFASPFEQERYDEVIHACALQEDLAAMASGDATRISGATVSGGQRARIALARAMYARSNIVLLDDILAAVDVHVQSHIIKHALTGAIAEGRTILLVTHHVASVASLASWMILLRNGAVAKQGPPKDMMDDIRFLTLNHKGQNDEGATETASIIKDVKAETTTVNTEEQTREADLLFEKEMRATGRIRLRTALFYLSACSVPVWLGILILTIAFRVTTVGEQIWLKVWGEAGQEEHAEHPQSFYLAIYASIGLFIIALNAAKVALFFWTSFVASRIIFEKTFSALLATSLRWFERRSAGQIQNRFGGDQNVTDNEAPQNLMNTLNNLFALASFLLICGYIVPWFLVPCVIGLVLGPYMVRGFIASTRDMQRIEATSMTPLYAVFGEALLGLTTIRAFGAEKLYLHRLTTTLEVVSAQWWAICSIEVWLSFRFQILGGIAVFIVSTLGLLSAVPSGSAAMLIASSQLLTQSIYFLLNDVKNLNRNLASIERLAEYAGLEAEEAGGKGTPSARLRAPAAWPSLSASIVIEGLVVRYLKHSPVVLQDINLTIRPGEKIAIVGKTGSGKSTLISCLLGGVIPEKGSIWIDGLDISTVSLYDLRSRCTLVPQDPVLLSGTVRSNLDPAGERSDEELLHILRQLQPDAASSNGQAVGSDSQRLPLTSSGGSEARLTNLDATITSGGSNVSAGQAQIISLARALVRASPIVILDEATSSASAEADALIQRLVRQNTTSTFITVAHRLSTIMDYDRVVVMRAGRIVEVGSPTELLAMSDGLFASMAKQ
ncbi:hypothetical protein OC846_004674 [Tilletia horrida]|uniref:Uncharacterized protein n=1 Tax=Tilletia horrida TaxID=155126 RepID=A0AAN6JQX9_9BASI|nr:hypothetical protein OC846_004674 [Tilletia horrida]KAK0554908.1 hypothetical protein OC845_000549 [Tilletia horrida]KAK0565176.1 hypothetical protein OC861_003911 [Tilletia horrida]